MKIRTDYVSNSSSSSFVLWGAMFDLEELQQKLKDINAISSKDEDCYKDYFYQWLNEQKIFDYDDHVIGDYEAVFGLKPTKMKDNETLLQFKSRIFAKLTEAGLPVASLDDIKLQQGINADGEIMFDN